MPSFRPLLLIALLADTALADEEMLVRDIRIPAGLLESYEGIVQTGPPKLASDPFDTSPPEKVPARPRLPLLARQVLEQNGIPFPEGSSCVFDPLTGMLKVRNTQHGFDLLESFLSETGCCHGPAGISWHLIVIEGPEAGIREAEKAAAHFPSAHRMVETLLSDERMSIVGDAFIEGPGGSRIEHRSGMSRAQIGHATRDKPGAMQIPFEHRHHGLNLAVESTMGPDGITLETDVRLGLAIGADSEEAVIKTSFTSEAGSTKLIGLTRGTSPGKLRAAFLSSSRRPHDHLVYRSLFRPAPPDWQAKAPAGMRAIVFAPPPGLLELAMRGNPRQSFIEWLERQGIAAAGSAAESENGTIRLIHTPECIERVGRMFDTLLAERPKNPIYTLQSFKAPAALLRSLVRKHAKARNHADLLQELTASNQSERIDFICLPLDSGQRGTHERGMFMGCLQSMSIETPGLFTVKAGSLRSGSRLQIEGVTYPADPMAHAMVEYDLHTALPKARRLSFAAQAGQKAGELPLHDHEHSITTCGIQLENGRPRLIALHPATKGDKTSLTATFLTCDLVPQIPLPSPSVVEPEQKTPPANPDKMVTRSLRVPTDFPAASAKEFLAAGGVLFPDGSSATYSPRTSKLVVRNTVGNLDLIEALLDDACYHPAKNIAVTMQAFEAPGQMVRDLHARSLSKSNHALELAEMEKAAGGGTATLLDSARLEARGGKRAQFDQGREVSLLEAISVDEHGAAQLQFWKRHDGFRVELEPGVAADGTLLQLKIDTESPVSPPVERKEHLIDPAGRRVEFPLMDFNSTKVVTSHSIPAGASQILSIWQPDPAKDVLRIVFVTARLESIHLTKE